MNLLRGMHIYTVHIPSGASDAQERAVFLREGFNWSAFFFGAFWALYHRLWLPAAIIFIVNSFLMMFVNQQALLPQTVFIFQLGFQILIGYHANDWLRAKLALRGYVLTDVTAADSLLRAEQRYFERILAHG